MTSLENENDQQEQQEQQEQEEVVQVSQEEKLKACLLILRKLPVFKYKKCVDALSSLIYEDDDLLNEFLQKIDQPSEMVKSKNGEYLSCEFNRDGDSYRSNIDNIYYPPSSETLRYPSKALRDFELDLNKLFREYTKLYYGGFAVPSAFAWEIKDKLEDGFCVAVVIKNQVDASKGVKGGCWDSSHLIVIDFDKTSGGLIAKYKLTSTVFFSASLNHKMGDIDFSGYISKLVRFFLLIFIA